MTVKVINSKQEFDALLASGKVIFIDFYADWCGPCRTISPEFEKLANEHAQEGAAEFYKVDIDKLSDVAAALQIRSIPTFHAYKNGQQVDKPLVGANKGALAGLVQTGLRLL